jgi:hypothetical protein
MMATDYQQRHKDIQQRIQPERRRELSMQQTVHAPQRTAPWAIETRGPAKNALWIKRILCRRKSVKYRERRHRRERDDPLQMLWPALHQDSIKA